LINPHLNIGIKVLNVTPCPKKLLKIILKYAILNKLPFPRFLKINLKHPVMVFVNGNFVKLDVASLHYSLNQLHLSRI
jgi:hypothetical protein